MSRTFPPSLREMYTDHYSLVEHGDTARRLLEEYRTLYTAALAGTAQETGVVLGISSSGAKEGKTTIATNIAFAMAQDLEKRVLLASAVFQPVLGHLMEEEKARPGLAEYIAEPKRDLETLLVHTPLPNLCVLFPGARPDNPSRLVRGERMRDAMATFRSRFDVTVVDMPPILSASDTQVLASLMDGVLLVVSLEHAAMDAVMRAARALESQTRLVGVAANRAQPVVPQWMTRIMGGGEWAAS